MCPACMRMIEQMNKKIHGGSLLHVYQNSTVISSTLSYQAHGRFLVSQCWHTIHGQQRLVVFQISLCILRKLEPLGKKLYACLTVSNYCVFSPLVALSFILGTKLKSACDSHRMHDWADDSEKQGRDGNSATLRTQWDCSVLFAVDRRDCSAWD